MGPARLPLSLNRVKLPSAFSCQVISTNRPFPALQAVNSREAERAITLILVAVPAHLPLSANLVNLLPLAATSQLMSTKRPELERHDVTLGNAEDEGVPFIISFTGVAKERCHGMLDNRGMLKLNQTLLQE